MTSYEIFDLLCSEFRAKFDGENVVFTQKYVFGKLQISIHFLKEENLADVVECLDFLNKYRKNLPTFSTGHLFALLF